MCLYARSLWVPKKGRMEHWIPRTENTGSYDPLDMGTWI